MLSSRLTRAGGFAQNLHRIDGIVIRGPGDELVGADEDERGVVALAAAVTSVADDLQGDAHPLGGGREGAANGVVAVESQQRPGLPQLVEDVAARGERLGGQMVARPRREGMSA